MTLLAMLRHGETQWSRERRIQGRADTPLCEEGRTRLCGFTLPDEWRTARVVSSPLKRCLETASALGLARVESDARLVEMRWGDWEGRRLDELRTEFGESMRNNEALGLDFTPPGGESPRKVFERVRGLLAQVAADREATLAITHRGVIRAVFANACGWDMRGRSPAKLDWSAIHIFKLAPDGMPVIHRMNVEMPPKNAGEAAA